MCRKADAVIEFARPGSAESLQGRGLGYAALRTENSKLVVCSISPFGGSGPYSAYRGSDISVVATGGNMYPTGNPDRAPVRCLLPVAYYHGGIEAAVGVVFALWGRGVTGEGQAVDVSLQETMLMASMTNPAQFPLTGFRGGRVGGSFRGGKALFRELWPCRDGYVSFALRGGPARIPGIIALIKYMDEHGMASAALKERDWSTYNHNLMPQEEVDAIESAIGAFLLTKTMQELYDAACERHLMLAPANTAREILASRQLAAREFFVEIEHPELAALYVPNPSHLSQVPLAATRSHPTGSGPAEPMVRDPASLSYPGTFAKTNLNGIGIRCRAPRLGEHNAEVYGELGLDVAALTAAGVI